MGTSVISKAELRKQILAKRKELTAGEQEDWDRQIFERLVSLGLDGKAVNPTGTVYCYVSVRGETGTEDLLAHYLNRGLRVAVPRVSGKDMDFYYIKSVADLEPGGFGIPEPKGSCERAAEAAAPVIVPGVAFSQRFERTGYGAGYYDRFFAREPRHEKIAICYDFQLLPAIEAESHDIPMDRIVTPLRSLSRKEDEHAC